MSYLKWFQTEVVPNESGFTVNYTHQSASGSVTYVKYVMENKMMRGKDVYLMTNSDMGDIIEVIHMNSPLSSYDYDGLNMEIRTHSRKLVENYKSV
jgi:hypothetical protein